MSTLKNDRLIASAAGYEIKSTRTKVNGCRVYKAWKVTATHRFYAGYMFAKDLQEELNHIENLKNEVYE